MDILNYLFSWAALWIWLTLAAAIAVLLYLRRHSSFGLTDFLYTLPLVGRLARYSNDYSKSSNEGWLNVENSLCRDYAKHCTAISQSDFDNSLLYLKKTYDHGRRPIPIWVIGLLAILIILEGLGFSYLLGGFMAMEGSEDTRQMLMVAIVLVLATILVWVTHHAGHQWFRTSLLRNCFREYQKNGDPSFTSQIVSLDDNQQIDDAVPSHVQCANRVVSKPGDVGNHAWAWIAGVLILTIAVGSTVLRLETLHTAQIEERSAAATPLMPGADLPPELAGIEPAPPAGTAVGGDPAAASKENAALAGFIMLAIIFIVTQLVGVGVGLRYGFAGKQSREARQATGGHVDYASYFQPIHQHMMIANSRLLKLHQLLEKHSPTPIEFDKNLFDFITEEQDRGATYLQMPPAPQKRLPPPRSDPESGPEEAQRPEGDGETTPARPHAAPTPSSEPVPRSGDEEVDEAVDRIDEAADEEAKVAVVEGLDPVLEERVLAWIRQRKAAEQEREARRQRIREAF